MNPINHSLVEFMESTNSVVQDIVYTIIGTKYKIHSFQTGGVEDEDEPTSALGPKPSDKSIPRIPSIRPTTPERAGTPSEDLEEHLGPDDSASQTGLDRGQLLEKYQQALNERDKILNQNGQLQHKIAEYFRKKKGADERQEVEKSVTDQEQR